ncbi:VanZ family protein [Methylotenera sp. 1P/1]|uniref:VanZ family protein n=1 Tax=Methylotenera sp. 1P/1 TaxID=1131551 RepID=UPI00037DB4CC|nr:VanZ family protein [Methylotenera sp. 1P/1]
MIQIIKRWVVASLPYLFMLLLTLVTYLMLIELPPKEGGWPYWDKVQHIAVFVMLTSLALLAFPKWRWQSAVGLAMYGAVIEWAQGAWTITRMPSVGDWLADVVGIAISLIVYSWLVRLPYVSKVVPDVQ